MNSLGKALKKKVGSVVDKGGNFIANKVMLQPSLDRMKGGMADSRRQKVLANRSARKMGY